jgi:tRNA-specific adenosine deaminase 3
MSKSISCHTLSSRLRQIWSRRRYIRKRQLVEDELSHLRRIYKNLSAGTTLIALYLTSKKSMSEVQADLADYDSELSDLKLVQKTVPARAAHSMKEVEHLRALWPVALRQRPIVASDLPWSADRKAWVKNGMQIVIDLAKWNKAQGELPVAVYAASPPLEAQLNEPDAIPPTPDIRASGVDTRKAARHPLRHATISCVTEIAKLRTVSPFADIQATRNGAGYLLTSLSVFMSHEPCVMCVMALVHSRVKEVFYLSSAGGASNGGGFGGSYPVHSHSGLNHQMDLFDCSDLVSQADIDDITVADIVDL